MPGGSDGRAKRLECVQLAAALGNIRISESGSKLHALQTLRAEVHLAPIMKRHRTHNWERYGADGAWKLR